MGCSPGRIEELVVFIVVALCAVAVGILCRVGNTLGILVTIWVYNGVTVHRTLSMVTIQSPSMVHS